MSAIDGLRACPLFKGFTDTGLTILAGIALPRAFPKGAPLFAEGMVGESLFVVVSGRVALSARSAQNEDVALGDVAAPGYLGELALIHQGQRMATATAMEDVSALELRHADFHRLLAQKPQACLKLLMNVVSVFGEKVQSNKDAFRSLVALAKK